MSSVTFAFKHAVTDSASIDQPSYSMYVHESQVYLLAYAVEHCLVVASVVALASK